MTAVNWLVSQPWPIFLPTFLGPLALLAGLLIIYIHHRRPPEQGRKPCTCTARCGHPDCKKRTRYSDHDLRMFPGLALPSPRRRRRRNRKAAR